MPLINKWDIKDFMNRYKRPIDEENWDKYHIRPMDEHYRAKWKKNIEDYPHLTHYIRKVWMSMIGHEIADTCKNSYCPPRSAIQSLYEYFDLHIEYMIKYGCDVDTLP